MVELADLRAHPPGQLLELRPQHLVVIAPQRVARNECPHRIGEHIRARSSRWRTVIHPSGDDAQGAGHERRGPCASDAVACHIIHRAVPVQVEPFQ
jgi:hypothetical protein